MSTRQQRTRMTKRAEEGRQFSSVKLPRKAEVKTANQSPLSQELRHGAKQAEAFDPIPNDGTFVIVENSRYWPPPPLESVVGQEAAARDNMDQYDRAADEAAAKTDRVKKKMGEVNHPRGRGPKNTKVVLADSDEENDDDDEDEAV